MFEGESSGGVVSGEAVASSGKAVVSSGEEVASDETSFPRVVVGVSSGADSVCLITLLTRLAGKLKISPVLFHVNHGIRGEEADRDEEFAANLAEKLGIPCERVKIDVPAYASANGLGDEEAGRILRYEAMQAACEKYGAGVAAVAHNADDNAETVIFNMLRGSSLKGIAGMKAVTDLVVLPKPGEKDPEESKAGEESLEKTEFGAKNLERKNSVRLVRPLLTTYRADIEAYLKELGISWCTDSTNLETDYSRNYIRHNIMPEFESLRPRAKEHINRLAGDVAGLLEFADALAEAEYKKRYKDGVLSLEGWKDVPEYLRMQLCYRYICDVTGHKKDISFVHASDVLKITTLGSGKMIDVPYGYRIKKTRTGLTAGKKEQYEQNQ